MKIGKKLLLLVISTAIATVNMTGVFAEEKSENAKITALCTQSKIYINGVETAFDAYNINDNNYFKLRDVAKAISGTEKQFDVSWDEENKSVNLISNTAYTEVGGEMVLGDGSDKTALPGVAGVYVDGEWVELTAYNIEDNNYFMLRDIGSTFDFNVYWDAETNSVIVDTADSYIGEAPLTDEKEAQKKAYEEYAKTVPRYPEYEEVADFGAINGVVGVKTRTMESDVGPVLVYLYSKTEVTQQMIDKYYIELLKTYAYMSPMSEEDIQDKTVNFVNITPRIITTMQDDEFFAVGFTTEELPEETAKEMLIGAVLWTKYLNAPGSGETAE